MAFDQAEIARRFQLVNFQFRERARFIYNAFRGISGRVGIAIRAISSEILLIQAEGANI